MRVALYVRRSTNETLQADSLRVQEQILRSFANTNGHTVVAVFRDSASGRSVKKRDGFLALLKTIESGSDFEGVLVRDVSRWGRFDDIDESAYWNFFCTLHGVQVIYTDEPFKADTSPHSALLKAVKRLLAAEFSRDKSRITQQSMLRVASEGFWRGGHAPYGMKRILVRLNGDYVQDLAPGEYKKLSTYRTKLAPGPEPYVSIVQSIFSDYFSGRSANEIAHALNAKNIPSPMGVVWRPNTVRTIIRNEAYAGISAVEAHVANEDIFAASVAHPRVRGARCEGAWVALVPFDTWVACNKKLLAESRRELYREFLPAQLIKAFEEWKTSDAWEDFVVALRKKLSGVPIPAEVSTTITERFIGRLGRHFQMRSEGEYFIVDEYLRIAVRCAVPHIFRRRMLWRFPIDGDQALTICIGMNHRFRHVKTFVVFNCRIRRKLDHVTINVVKQQRAWQFRSRQLRDVVEAIRHAILWSPEHETKPFVEVAREQPMFSASHVGKVLGWPTWRARYVYNKLTKCGIALPPRSVVLGRRLTWVCEGCGRKERRSPRHELRRATQLCRSCYEAGRRAPRIDITCPECGAVRTVRTRAAGKLTKGANTLCLPCTLKAGRKKRELVVREQQPWQRHRESLRVLLEAIAQKLREDPRSFKSVGIWWSYRTPVVVWCEPDGSRVALRVTTERQRMTPKSVAKAVSRALDVANWISTEPTALCAKRWTVAV